MSDPVQIVASLIRDENHKALAGLGAQLRQLFNRRNANIFLHALIDQASKSHAKNSNGDALASLRVFAKAGIALNDPLDNGDLPLNAMMARSPELAKQALQDNGFDWDLNSFDRAGRTPLMQSLEVAKSSSANMAGLIRLLIESPSLKLNVKDQGAFVAFTGIYWIAVAGAVAGREESSLGGPGLVHALARRGYDFNVAKLTPDVALGAKINTPMAYCIKKAAQWMQWNHGGKKELVADSICATVNALIECGADPSLQMEPGQRVALMAFCKESGFPPGMMQTLEAGVLKISVASPLCELAGLASRPRRL